MLSAQSEFAKLCVFYLQVIEIRSSKVEKTKPISHGYSLEKVYYLFKKPFLLISKLRSLILILENGGLNHISRLDNQSEIFNYLSEYSKQQLAALQKLAEIILSSQNGWLSELPILKTVGIISMLAALFYMIYETINQTQVVKIIIDSYVTISNILTCLLYTSDAPTILLV